MNVLVVGGAGYIGSHTTRALERAGHAAWVFDNLTTGHRAAAPPGRLIAGDLSDQAKLVSALLGKRIEAVLHFAACALVGESVTDPAKYYRNNVAGTLTLLDAMRTAGVGKMVFSSTTATYGNPRALPITEDQPQQPINPYGFTKLVIERALEDYARAYGLGYAALRYFNAAGASLTGELGEDHRPETHLIPLVLQVALGQRSHIVIMGGDYPTPDGACVRDYVHVEDLARAHVLALERLEPGRGLQVNLGSGAGYSVREIVAACRRVTGHCLPEVEGARRPGDPAVLVADNRLARELLEWSPRHSDLDTIVATAWRWHQTHPHGYAGRA